jgi:hypothetical protein
MKLSLKAFALAGGILCGLAVLLVTLVALLRGSPGDHLIIISTIHPGYSVSYLGAIIGMVWGFVDGLIGGAVFAWLYNRLA